MKLVSGVLLLLWGCGDKETADDEPVTLLPGSRRGPPDRPQKPTLHDDNPKAPQIAPDNHPNESKLVYESFPGHELETFKTNTDLRTFLLELSKKEQSQDSFGSDRLRPNMNLWDKPMEVLRMGAQGKSQQFLAKLNPNPIYLVGGSGVFEITSVPLSTSKKFVLKYRLECEDWANLHYPNSVVQEAWFMSQLSPKGFTTPVVYYSDPALNVRTDVPVSGIVKLKKISCDATHGGKPIIRYMISERMGIDLHDFLYSKSKRQRGLSFQDKIKIGGQMIMYLERLHALNIVHGDAHTGNWIIDKGVVKMIDFGRSKIITESELDANKCRVRSTSSHLWNTKWEMRSCPYSYRDDVIQAVFMMGIMLHGHAFQKYVEYLEKDPATRLSEHERLKSEAMFFEYKPSAGFVVNDSSVTKLTFIIDELLEGRDPSIINTVRDQLAIVSGISSDDKRPIQEKPDYEAIKKALGAIIYALDGLRSDDFSDWFRLPTYMQ